MRAVLDTNVLVSGIFFGGVPGKILDAWTQRRFEIFVTPGILDEYASALQAVGGKETESLRNRWINAIAGHAHHVLDPAAYPRICRDSHDDKFLYCSMAVRVDYLVTGDKDLKILEDSYSFKIVSPRAFLEVLQKQ